MRETTKSHSRCEWSSYDVMLTVSLSTSKNSNLKETCKEVIYCGYLNIDERGSGRLLLLLLILVRRFFKALNRLITWKQCLTRFEQRWELVLRVLLLEHIFNVVIRATTLLWTLSLLLLDVNFGFRNFHLFGGLKFTTEDNVEMRQWLTFLDKDLTSFVLFPL